MKDIARVWRLAIVLAIGVVSWTPSAAGQIPAGERGVVVEEVGEGSALEKAGLRPGDIVLAWERLPAPPANPQRAHGTIESVFDWMWLEVEQAPRGTVKLMGQRDREVKVFEVGLGPWDATLRARMPEEMLEDYAKGKELIEAEELEAGIGLWYEAAGNQAADDGLGYWLLLRIGDVWSNARQWEKAHIAYRSSLEVAQDPRSRVALWQAVGKVNEEANEFEAAREAYVSAQEIRERTWSESLAIASGLNDLGRLALRQERFDLAKGDLQRALKIGQTLAPGSLHVATTLSNLGVLAYHSDDFDRAAEYFEKALGIRQKLVPGSIDVASSLFNLGLLAYERSDLDRATEYYEKSLEIRQKLVPGSLYLARNLNNLGVLAVDRGDLDRAAEFYEKALEIREELAPGSLSVAASLDNLGVLYHKRSDLDRAMRYYERSLEIRQALVPNSLAMATSLNNLGIFARQRGEFELASEYYTKSLEIRQALAPVSLDVAQSLNNLGILALDRGDLDQAVEFFDGALEIKKKLVPGSLDVVQSLSNLGRLASDRGNLDRAAEYYEKSLEIEQILAPGSSGEAGTRHALALVRRKQNQPQPALYLFLQALQALENQITRLGGSRDVQAGFRAERIAYYRDTIHLLLELQQPEKAFHTLERSRARSFLAQLAERDLVFSGIPEELELKRWRIARSYDETQAEIMERHPREQAEEIETLLTRLQQLRRDYEDITEKIVKTSPKLGALRYPQPLDLDAARQALDPRTVMLSYSIGKDETHLFILTREEKLEVLALPIGEQKLRGEVEKILKLQKRKSATLLYEKPLHQAGERLYQALIQPAEKAIAKSKRLLIVPDGPLHLLPFALLVRNLGPGEGHGDRDYEYLVEWKPLHSVLSATVYAELKDRRRRQPGEATDVLALAAFGDPRYASKKARDELIADRNVDVYVRAAAERGFDFRPIPYTREEVNEIAALYPEGAAYTFLGAKATEEQAKSVGERARILHFATHGRYDDRFPLNSYLALTIPKEFRKDQENGLLQAWEIFESVRLDADLVVLSACESGLGDEIDGEGLKGLTRAFQFAGARTVASSLWQVNDRATAELMRRFYHHLKTGTSKDEALRAAQLELIRGPVEMKNSEGKIEDRDLSSPYYWAAFQMIGDWR